jgi:hypothetical protein
MAMFFQGTWSSNLSDLESALIRRRLDANASDEHRLESSLCSQRSAKSAEVSQPSFECGGRSKTFLRQASVGRQVSGRHGASLDTLGGELKNLRHRIREQ